MAPLEFGGHDFGVVGGTALFWPRHSALIVADLHLEKASWFAARGQFLPPHDSRATLERLGAVAEASGAKRVFCLGDNFHDSDGAGRMDVRVAALLADLTSRLDWLWIVGNHDPDLPEQVGGEILVETEIDGLVLRHEADPAELRPELSGHFHPKYRARGPRGGVTRPCFVRGGNRLILPAFGALTGGLAADHPALQSAVGKGAEALLATGNRLLSFPL
jgi:uncharacterized protein